MFMLRKLACALFVMGVAVTLVAADEFTATITKVDGNKVTFQKYKKGEKGKKGEKDGEPVTLTVAKDAKIAAAKFNKTEKKLEVGDPIEGGLKADVFAKATEEKGVQARITTSDDNKTVTQILTFQFGKGKDKKTTDK
jgi:hypothetical protein